MAYDQDLADRIRECVARERGVVEQRMFGGLAFLINGHLSVSASGRGGLLVRVDPAEGGSLIDGDGVTPMVMAGREQAGWLRVDGALVESDGELERWVARGVGFAKSLPPKKPRR